jgi:hypothetical protein
MLNVTLEQAAPGSMGLHEVRNEELLPSQLEDENAIQARGYLNTRMQASHVRKLNQSTVLYGTVAVRIFSTRCRIAPP